MRNDDDEDNSNLRVKRPYYFAEALRHNIFLSLNQCEGILPHIERSPKNKSIGIPVLAPIMQLRLSIASSCFTQ